MGKFNTKLGLFIVLVITIFVYFRFYYVYDRKVRTGQLESVDRTGHFFKTNEGKLMLSADTVFHFSVPDQRIAQKLMDCGNCAVRVRYKEYLGSLPWRGQSRFIVDSILSATPAATGVH